MIRLTGLATGSTPTALPPGTRSVPSVTAPKPESRAWSVPRWLDPLFEGLDDDQPGRELVSASLAAEQCADLAAHGVRHVHFYTLNRANLTRAVCRLLRVGAAA